MANLKFQNAIRRIPQKTPPIWFMRQAGRYHRHYQKLKEKYDFMTLCKEPELAAEVALGPIQDFDFDVAILFSDLLFPLEALGMGLTYDPGPKLGYSLSEKTITGLRSAQEALPYLEFQKKALNATRERLSNDKSLIGFVGGPWTLFTYAVAGDHKGSLIQAKTQMALYRQLMETLVPLLKENIRLQLDGGAEVVMIFDTAAGELSSSMFRQEIMGDLWHLADAFPGRLGYYSKGTTPDHLTELWAGSSWAGFGLDHRFHLPSTFKEIPHGFLQGNFDQALMFCETEDFKRRLNSYLEEFSQLSEDERCGWICGLGHGVLPKTPENHVRYFVERVKEVFQ